MLLDNGDTEGCPTVFSEAMGHELFMGGTGAGADTAIIRGKMVLLLMQETKRK